ncbi:Transposase domain protein (plasmid) [Candidatus Bandiella woodruffii]|uniref:Transposase domain protein n=2 Tax=Candidatus Bandiella euplotis TaxID=1664265 RepID=A0ABZ0UMU0_9RICK|nr:Transposase domain protein [Candidatus Bandiella woodruffii]
MKIQNISLPEKYKDKLIKIKWHLWHGNADKALSKLSNLIEEIPPKYRDQLKKLKTYLNNNSDKIVNYQKRQEQGLVFTSNLAESTVESLIN